MAPWTVKQDDKGAWQISDPEGKPQGRYLNAHELATYLALAMRDRRDNDAKIVALGEEDGRLRLEIDRLQAVVEKYDKTRDGVPVVPNMKLFCVIRYAIGPAMLEATAGSIYARTKGDCGIQPSMCCSTPEAAEADYEKRVAASAASACPEPVEGAASAVRQGDS